ncbi:MAG: class I SAM-dependent methyltransferase [Candidatus Hodarchaeota archaeon]
MHKNLKAENEKYFCTDQKWISEVCDAWMNDESNSKHRYDIMRSVCGDDKLKESRILDMSSGCGTFVFYGLLNGYNVYGVEPEKWKHRFNSLKAKEKGYPSIWMNRFHFGVGERLPFQHESFDVISTYQTLEHVQSHKKCFSEFKRVLKKGGYLFIQCPNYTSFFEGHYRIPMLPLMNKRLFKIFLKLLKRPTEGLNTINYITRKMILDYLGNDYRIYDISLIRIKARIHNRFKINSGILARTYRAYSQIRNICRCENSVNLAVLKK